MFFIAADSEISGRHALGGFIMLTVLTFNAVGDGLRNEAR
jgi:hypothetical protein